MTQKQYAKMVKEVCPKSPLWKDCICAFVIGGLNPGAGLDGTVRQHRLAEAGCRNRRVHDIGCSVCLADRTEPL